MLQWIQLFLFQQLYSAIRHNWPFSIRRSSLSLLLYSLWAPSSSRIWRCQMLGIKPENHLQKRKWLIDTFFVQILYNKTRLIDTNFDWFQVRKSQTIQIALALIRPTSIECEQCFNICRRTLTEFRCNMSDPTLDAIIFPSSSFQSH